MPANAEAGNTGAPSASQPGAPQSSAWETAVGRGEACLRANARRYKVKARNAARAALTTLRRHGITITEAQTSNLHIAVYDPGRPNLPKAVYAVAGDERAPELQLRYARLQSQDTPLYQRGGPLDRVALRAGMPRAARFRAEEQLGTRGLREVMNEQFWEREISLYVGTAVVLAAFGFPMSPGVFVVGGVLLLIRGAFWLLAQELRLWRAKRRIAADESLQPILHTAAIRRLFATGLGIAPDSLDSRLAATVLSGQVIVPDLTGGYSLHMYVDEDAAVAVGALRPAQLNEAVPAEEPDVVSEHISASANLLTVVFRKPKRVRMPQEREREHSVPEARPKEAPKVDLDDLGRQAKKPAKVDFDEIGRKGRDLAPAPANPSPPTKRPHTGKNTETADIEDADVVDAEVVEDGDPPTRRGRGDHRA